MFVTLIQPYLESYKLDHQVTESCEHSTGSMSCSDQASLLELQLPNEVIDTVLSYLSSEELLILARVCTERLKNCSYRVVRQKFTELPSLLCKFSREGDFESIKQLFGCINQDNVNLDKVVVKNNHDHQKKISSLVNTNCSSVGRSPLMEATLKGHPFIAEYLITQHNANVDSFDFNHDTALIQAARNNNEGVVKVLLDHNANIKSKNKYDGHAAYYAALNGDLNILKLLVEKDKEVINLKGSFGCTPLIAASEEGCIDVCKYLVENNADINLQDDSGVTALQVAATNHHAEIIQLLANLDNNLS